MFDLQMDFRGQEKAEILSRFIISLFGVVSLIVGGVYQQFSMTIYIFGAGFLLALIVAVPPYQFYRQDPLNWQPSRDNKITEDEIK